MGISFTEIEFKGDSPELSSLLEKASSIAGVKVRKNRDNKVYLRFLPFENASISMRENRVILTYNMGSIPLVVKIIVGACLDYGGVVVPGNIVNLPSRGSGKLSKNYLIGEFLSKYAVYAFTGLPILIFLSSLLFGFGFLVYFGVSKLFF